MTKDRSILNEQIGEESVFDRVQRTGDFHEWWTPGNQPRGSGAFRGSAGVRGRAIEMLQARAHNVQFPSGGFAPSP